MTFRPWRLRIITYNIRKGRGASGRRAHSVVGVGSALACHRADLVLCQEVFHTHDQRNAQTVTLARALGLSAYYRPNKTRRIGHHGNATFTAHPVSGVTNFDLSLNRLERRGALYVRLDVWGIQLHVINVHLSLSHRQRSVQLGRVGEILTKHVSPAAPVVLAGDFNDWHDRLERRIVGEWGFSNPFAQLGSGPTKTWPAWFPWFGLDRVYLRHLRSSRAERLEGGPWRGLSDHLPLMVVVEPK